jgi:pre-rRNA-processing protein TSR1
MFGGEQNNFGKLIAHGQLHSVNPDRILLKKILLSGIPFRVIRNKARAKQMFYSPEDVRWFKPVDLWTKHGLSGRIVEPLGTHGNMKCVFDGNVGQQDSIMMSLYKRVFPQWVTLPELERPQAEENHNFSL